MADSIGTLIDRFEREAEADRAPLETPDVGIIMGSDSDLDVMAGAGEALRNLGFEEVRGETSVDAKFTYETYVISAHRTPDLMYSYAETAERRGLDIIIAGAGGKSADLPNMTASIAYPVPVIGVPVQEKSVDSVIGMPRGAPIVAVDAGKSFNAGLTAAQVLAINYPELRDRLSTFHEDLRESVGEVSERLNTLGIEQFRRERDE